MSLFPTGPSAKNGNLLEFRAGRMTKEGKLVSPDVRKGLVYMLLRDGLMHFCWKDRKTQKEEEGLIIFPSDAEFVKVEQSNQRVFMLRFKGTSRRLFFWMQEPKEDNDNLLVKQVNYLINCPPTSNSGDPFADVDFDTLDSLARPIPEVVEESEAVPPTEAPEAPVVTLIGGHVPTPEELTALQKLLSGISMPDNLNLTDVLTSDVLSPLLSDEAALETLKPFLPLPHTPEAMNAVIKSPQFVQALQAFNSALKSGQVSSSQLGVGSDNQQFT
eukprot:Ihof_evm4s118 gene=Ihof_evmTU4s118